MCVKSIDTSLHIFAMAICRENLPQLFAATICRGNLPRLFAVAICREYLPCLFAVGLFCVSKQTFFLCERIFVSKLFLTEGKPFSYESKTFFNYENFFF